MKKFLIVFCSVVFVSTVTVFAYNIKKGPAKQIDGITELPLPQNDSLIRHGQQLVSQMHYSENDLNAIKAYLNSK
jgi:hypothetical protein